MSRLVLRDITGLGAERRDNQRALWEQVFSFWPGDRRYSGFQEFSDCHITEVAPKERVTGPPWSDEGGPADPNVFAELFPRIVERLSGADARVYLYISSVDAWRYDEVAVIRDHLVPRDLTYLLLAPQKGSHRGERPGNLIFECPSDFAAVVAGVWFGDFLRDVAGYVLPPARFGAIADYYFRPDSATNARAVLSLVRCEFKIWNDHNGMDVFSESLDVPEIERLLGDL